MDKVTLEDDVELTFFLSRRAIVGVISQIIKSFPWHQKTEIVIRIKKGTVIKANG